MFYNKVIYNVVLFLFEVFKMRRCSCIYCKFFLHYGVEVVSGLMKLPLNNNCLMILYCKTLAISTFLSNYNNLLSV